MWQGLDSYLFGKDAYFGFPSSGKGLDYNRFSIYINLENTDMEGTRQNLKKINTSGFG